MAITSPGFRASGFIGPGGMPLSAASAGLGGALGTATETDAAQAISAVKQVTVNPATETDSAQPITQPGAMPVGVATETDTAQPITAQKVVSVGVATETDTAQSISRAQVIALSPATEADSAIVLSIRKDVAVGTATETDSAQQFLVNGQAPVSTGGGIPKRLRKLMTLQLPDGTLVRVGSPEEAQRILEEWYEANRPTKEAPKLKRRVIKVRGAKADDKPSQGVPEQVTRFIPDGVKPKPVTVKAVANLADPWEVEQAIKAAKKKRRKEEDEFLLLMVA